MTDLIRDQFQRLASTLTLLHSRVRTAVAGEMSRAVADAVGEILATVLGGSFPALDRYADASTRRDPYSGQRSSPYRRDDWDEDDGWQEHNGASHSSDASESHEEGTSRVFDPTATAAVLLAVTAGRWWCRSRGTRWGALGLGLAVAGTTLSGGPIVQAGLRVVWAAYRLLSATDALGEGARALDRR